VTIVPITPAAAQSTAQKQAHQKTFYNQNDNLVFHVVDVGLRQAQPARLDKTAMATIALL